MYRLRVIVVLLALGMAAAGPCRAQRRGGGAGGGYYIGGPVENYGWVMTEGNIPVNADTVRTARETAGHSVDLPAWQNAPGFEKDVFTFTRVIYGSNRYGGGWGDFGYRRPGWIIDYPDADLNLSYRLHQVTSMKVDPDCRILKLTNPDLIKYPLLYTEHPGRMMLSSEEGTALHNYLVKGGVLLVNDFWGPEWDVFAQQMLHVLPGHQWVDLPFSHPIFHCVFDLQGQVNNYQVPTIHFWNRDYDPNDPFSGPSSLGPRAYMQMAVRAILDDRGRIMVLAIYNSDTSDGWERESENETYFHMFSEKRAYPLIINFIVYIMTH